MCTRMNAAPRIRTREARADKALKRSARPRAQRGPCSMRITAHPADCIVVIVLKFAQELLPEDSNEDLMALRSRRTFHSANASSSSGAPATDGTARLSAMSARHVNSGPRGGAARYSDACASISSRWSDPSCASGSSKTSSQQGFSVLGRTADCWRKQYWPCASTAVTSAKTSARPVMTSHRGMFAARWTRTRQEPRSRELRGRAQ
mmetsp:Transcript_19485/g.54908  ORF Transcript_19485/g.54908 Transcript_19485/m.54908 type:complete len:206 (+) Transcript_19485:489-1106(+)